MGSSFLPRGAFRKGSLCRWAGGCTPDRSEALWVTRPEAVASAGSELVERSFAHVCETGGGRRTWLRGPAEVSKRYVVQVAAHNLGLRMRKLFGVGKPRTFQ